MHALEIAVRPLDIARRAILRLAIRSPWLTRVLARRDSRIAALAAIQIVLVFVFSVGAPVALFFLGPILLGTIHLAADVRYLVLRRTVPRALILGSIAAAIALTVVRVGVETHRIPLALADRVDVAVGCTWVAFGLLSSHRADLRRWALPLLIAAGALVAHAHLVSRLLVHLHNVLAIVVWLVLFRRRVGWATVPTILLIALTLVLLSGVTLPWTFGRGGDTAFGVYVENLAMWLSPGWPIEPALALTASFVFLQGVHYSVWLGWIPQEDLPGQGTPTFRMTLRSLVQDFGKTALLIAGAIALGFVVLALWNIRTSLVWYMVLAKSHAWFECAFLAHFIARGDRFGMRAT